MRTQSDSKDQKCAELGKPKCWEGVEGRHQSYDSKKIEAREVSGKEGRSHLLEMLAFFTAIISLDLFDVCFLCLS